MENEVTETQSETQPETQPEVRVPKIKASRQLWARFEEWMRVQGCQTLPEGLRAAMRQVTNFNGQSQQQTS